MLVNDSPDPICPICNYKVKKWARAKCDGCGRTVCKSHRPWFDFSGERPRLVQTWYCPECLAGMKKFQSS